MRIIHIITGLGDGGAENALFKICKYDNLNKHIVISLKKPSKYFFLLKKLKIKVYSLNFRFYSFHKFFFLVKLIRILKPDLVQTWLVHADFLGSIASRLAGIKKILWNVRYSNLEIGKAKLSTIFIIKILSIMSHFVPKVIVIVSKKAKKIYENLGYNKKLFKFIPNGYDLKVLRIDKTQKKNLKKKFKISNKIPLIGKVARYDPQKNHFNLLKALSIIKSKNINFFCVLVGSNISYNNIELISEIQKLKLFNNIKLLGQENKISTIMSGLDLHVLSSSYGEGFPNVVAESMACGTPNIVTDIGDSKLIVGKTGWVVPPKNPAKLSKAIENGINEINKLNWNKRCKNARSIIKKYYSISKMLSLYNKVWFNVYREKQIPVK